MTDQCRFVATVDRMASSDTIVMIVCRAGGDPVGEKREE